jgi:hypothetical protein
MLGVSRWVYDAARSGRIPSVRLGGQDGPDHAGGADAQVRGQQSLL